MINAIKKLLGLNPLPTENQDIAVNIQIGILDGKLCIKLDRKLDIITLNKVQLSQLLAAIATRAVEVK